MWLLALGLATGLMNIQAESSVELIADLNTRAEDGAIYVAARFETIPDWHIYYLNPGEAGMPPSFQFKLPQGWAVGDPMFPTPKIYTEHNTIAYGYGGETIVLYPVYPPEGATLEGFQVEASAHWLACEAICKPFNADVSVTLTQNDAHGRLIQQAKSSLPKPFPGGIQVRTAEEGFTVQFEMPADTTRVDSAFLFLEQGELTVVTAKQDFQFQNGKLSFELPWSRYLQSRPSEIRGILKTQSGEASRDWAVKVNISSD